MRSILQALCKGLEELNISKIRKARSIRTCLLFVKFNGTATKGCRDSVEFASLGVSDG